MERSQRIFVTGITGQQGGAVACHLLNKNVKVYGLTRNANSEKAKALVSNGVAILEGDLNDSASYDDHLKDMDAVFCVQSFEQGKENEIKQGKVFIDCVRSNGINHFVYSSVLGADLDTGVPHFESKNILEDYIKATDLNYTILRPASFNENFLNPEVTKRLKKGKLVMPLNKNVTQQYISTDDIGKIAAQVITRPNKYHNKTISIATDQKNMTEVAQLFGQAMERDIKYQKLPGFITRLIMGKELSKMFNYMNKTDFVFVDDITALKEEFLNLGDLRSWINTNFQSAN